MKISIVIPAYNASKTIERALFSVMEQTIAPHEIIVVSDGSTDATETIIRQKFPEVELITLMENKGVSFARNEGIRKATGEWIAFLDADDCWHPEKLNVISFFIEKIPNATGFSHLFSSKPIKETIAYKNIIPEKVVFWRALLHNKIQGSSLVIKVGESLWFNPDFRYCEDHELALRIAWKKQLFFLPLCLTKLGREQLSPGGLSGHRIKMRKGEMKLYSRIGHFNPWLAPLVPMLLLLSILKHAISKVRISAESK